MSKAKKKKVSFSIRYPNSAGIDVGSKSHYVAIGQSKNDVKEFGVYNEDLGFLVQHLLDYDITHVCMESTGTYWQSLYSFLLDAGIVVCLCNGKYTKNPSGKKTDVLDCQNIQLMYSLGMIPSSFLPDSITEELRTYTRHRSSLIGAEADSVRRMQKYLRLLNVRLDVVVKDITGLTGIKIIQAICAGERSPEILASFRNGNCKKPIEEFVKALQSNHRQEYLRCLKLELAQYKNTRALIDETDDFIKSLLDDFITNDEKKIDLVVEKKPHKRINKNTPKNMDLNQLSFQYFEGVDLMAIEGVSHATVLSIMSEVGKEGFNKFESAKQFASWLHLSPNTKKTGGKVINSHVPKGGNRLKKALRDAANVIGNLKDTHLSDFFKRVLYKSDRVAAISATARKLAVIIWNMITKKVPYNPPKEYLMLDQKRKLKLVARVKKTIAKFELKPEDVGFATC